MTRKCAWAVPIVLVLLDLFAVAVFTQQSPPSSAWPLGALVAEGNQRIDPNGLAIHILFGTTAVHLAQPVALFVVTPFGKQGKQLAQLDGKSVVVVRSDNQHDRWNIYEESQLPHLTPMLVDNAFLVKQVLISSRLHPVRVRLDGRTIHLKQGEALLVV